MKASVVNKEHFVPCSGATANSNKQKLMSPMKECPTSHCRIAVHKSPSCMLVRPPLQCF